MEREFQEQDKKYLSYLELYQCANNVGWVTQHMILLKVSIYVQDILNIIKKYNVEHNSIQIK